MSLATRSACAVAAAGLVASAVVQLGHTVPDHHWGTRGAVLAAVFTVGLLGALVALEEVRDALALRRLGTVGVRVAQAGLALMTVQNVASWVHGGDVAGGVFFVGIVATLVGLLLVAIDGVQAGTALRWLAPLPLVGLLVGIAGGEHGGLFVWGLTWLAWLVPAFRRAPVAA